MTEAEVEFQSALAIARHALEQFNEESLVASKRGGPRLSPWFRVWVQASEIAQRWHRQMTVPGIDHPSLDEELDRILGKPEQ